jgi:WD40 repeat protein
MKKIVSETLSRKNGTFFKMITPLHPCSLQVVPSRTVEEGDVSKKFFYCGCYELDESTKQRKGKVLFGSANYPYTTTSLICEYDTTSGVLDLVCVQNKVILALSSSSLEIHYSSEEGFSTLAGCSKSPDEGLFLSVNSNITKGTSSSFHGKIIVSTQSGSVIVYSASNSNDLCEEYCFESAHQMFGENMPVWISNISPYDENCIVSGGDDMQFKIWDLRTPAKAQMVSKFHQAGVTTLEWDPYENNNLFLSGSYDELCAIWDFRSMKSPLLEIPTGNDVNTVLFCCRIILLCRRWRVEN